MRIIFVAFTLLFMISPSLVFAMSHLVCGDLTNAEDGTVKGFELELSSSHPSDYSGPLGETWKMKLRSPDSEWLTPTDEIVARTIEGDMSIYVEISIYIEDAATGPMGVIYRLYDIEGAQPFLEKYNYGGFTGSIKVGSYQCMNKLPN